MVYFCANYFSSVVKIIRNKRSIDDGRYNNEMLQPEHRSLDDMEHHPSYKSYNFEIGSPRHSSNQYEGIGEFKAMPTSSKEEHDFSNKAKSYDYTRKSSAFKSNKNRDMFLTRGSLKDVEEFDQIFAPSSSIASPTTGPEETNSIIYADTKPKKKKMRTRTAIKVRKSRPLPTGPSPTFASPTQETRMGDAFLRSIAEESAGKQMDFSPDGPVMGLITSYAQHERDSPICQKRALCEMAMKGKTPTASKFETFLWSLASL